MRHIRYLLLPLTLAMVFGSVGPAAAQFPSPAPAVQPTNPAIRQEGAFSTGRVTIDNLPVFKIATLAKAPPGALPIDTRLLLVQSALNQILAIDPATGETVFDPKTLDVGIAREGSQYVLSATDVKHREPIAIVTVTSQDAQYAGMTDLELAQQWKTLLQPALVKALTRREPAEIRNAITTMLRFAVIGAVVTVIALTLCFFVRKRSPGLALAIVWLLVFGWATAIAVSLLQFSQTVAIGRSIIRSAVRVAFIWLAAWIVNWILGIVINQVSIAYAHRTATDLATQRHLLRAPTISRTLNGFKSVLIVFAAFLGTLSALEIPVASVVTIGGIVAVAVGFAAQSLVRDCLGGMLVLFEDQYVVGDYVMIGDYNGVVEKLTLRVVQIRDSRGNLITIPHSAVTQVVNASRSWGRIDYRVAVDPAGDLAKSISALKTAFESMGQSEAWRDAIFEPVESIGVELISKNGIVLRAMMRCAPLRQFELRRAIQERVLEEFANQGIALGIDPNDAKAINPTVSPNPA